MKILKWEFSNLWVAIAALALMQLVSFIKIARVAKDSRRTHEISNALRRVAMELDNE